MALRPAFNPISGAFGMIPDATSVPVDVTSPHAPLTSSETNAQLALAKLADAITGITVASVPLVATTITQNSHGFAVKDVVAHNGTQWTKASASVAACTGQAFVYAVTTNTFSVAFSGRLTLTSHGLTIGQTYYLSNTLGTLATSVGTVSQAVCYVEGANTLIVSPISRTATPVPTLTDVSLKTLSAASAVTLEVTGTGFTSGMHVIAIDGSNQSTTFVSSTTLRCTPTMWDAATKVITVVDTIGFYSPIPVSKSLRIHTASGNTWVVGSTIGSAKYYALSGGGGGGGGGGSNYSSGGGGGGGGSATASTGTISVSAGTYTVLIGTGGGLGVGGGRDV